MARTGVSDIFKEQFSKIAGQVSRTAKSRSPNPNYKPMGIAVNEKRTATVDLQIGSENSVVTTCTDYIFTRDILRSFNPAPNVIFHALSAVQF